MNERTEKALVDITKNGLKSNRKELIDLALKKGLNLGWYYHELTKYCIDIIYNYNSLAYINKSLYEYFRTYEKEITIADTTFDGFENLSCLENVESIIISNCLITSFDGIEKMKSKPKIIHIEKPRFPIRNNTRNITISYIYAFSEKHDIDIDIIGIDIENTIIQNLGRFQRNVVILDTPNYNI